MQEEDNILRILEETKIALKEKNTLKLRELSDQTIHTASTTQDFDNVMIAVIVYSLSKVIERSSNGLGKSGIDFEKKIEFYFDGLVKGIKEKNHEKVHRNMESLRKEIGKLTGKIKRYIQDVLRKASINKASKIYEHGISMERTASLLGITMYELASYTGQKNLENKYEKTVDVKSRIKIAMEMFQ